MGQSGGASRWRVFYQRGLPGLVFGHNYEFFFFKVPCGPRYVKCDSENPQKVSPMEGGFID